MAVLANRVRMNVTGAPGTGTVTLNAAFSSSFLTFNEASVPDGAKVSYAIDDGNDFEIGYGTYTAAGTTMTRDTVLVSKIGGVSGTTKLTLTANAQVRIAYVQQSIRTRLIADIIYYIATTGSNSNNGLSASTPWQSIQYAWDFICDNLDLNGFTVTIQVADGTYTTGLGTHRGVPSAKSSSTVVIQGNNGTPSNVLFSTTSTHAFSFGYPTAELGCLAQVRLKDFKIQTTTSGDCLNAMGGGAYIQFDNLNFGASAGYHIVSSVGAYIYESGAVSGPGPSSYSVSGGAIAHVQAAEGGQVTLHGATITFTVGVTFTTAFAYALWGGRIFLNSMTFTNSTNVTSTKRFQVEDNGFIYTGASRTYLPGTTEGTVASGGVYHGTEVFTGYSMAPYNNLVINGGAEVAQEYGTTTISSAANGIYPIDMVKYSFSGTMSVNIQQVTDAPAGYRNSIKVTVNTGETLGGTNPGHYSLLTYLIEGTRLARLGWGAAGAQQIAIAFWSKIHRTGTYSVCLLNDAGNRSYTFTFTQNTADTWQLNTAVVSGDTSPTWQTGTVLSLQVIFPVGVGNTFVGSANTWSASAIFGATGTTNSVAATTDIYQITGLVVLPANELPTSDRLPNVIRPFSEELILSKRYFETTYSYGTQPGSNTDSGVINGYADSTTTIKPFHRYEVEKRASPTIICYTGAISSGAGNSSTWTRPGAAQTGTATAQSIGAKGFLYILLSSASVTTGEVDYGHLVINSRM